MLRVGLTGGLGSGKSTVAALLRADGFAILEADAIARELMQPGQPVFRAIVEHFGPEVVRADGGLDRARLADLVFHQGRLSELNCIVHPPVIAEQERRMAEIFDRDPGAIVVVESALIFEAEAWGTVPQWRRRFDRVVLVAAPDELKIQRFLARILPAGASADDRARADRDARARLSAQIPDAVKIPRCDAVIDNAGSLDATRAQVDRLVARLRTEAGAEAPAFAPPLS
ncbi:MAG TPA: dephospho-CoA kinase [Acidobacteriaceae bacterium]|jgi:dephospho-CoA kinase|nr:dephospho-CoA kinase [Acidobacteriaceae bacterium]